MNSRKILIFAFLISGTVLFSQPTEMVDLEEKYKLNEIGVSNGTVYFTNSSEFAYGFHLHYTRSIRDTNFGFGLSFGHIFDDHGHTSLGLVASYEPVKKWVLGVSPGIVFEHQDFSKGEIAIHADFTYEFSINQFHLGPAVEFAAHHGDYHLGVGLHLGYGF